MKIKVNTLFLLFSCYFIIAQNASEKKLFVGFDKIIGLENAALSYGALFEEKYRSLKGNHHYFKSDEFKSASIVYNGEPYFDVKLKYDITDDNIIRAYSEGDKKIKIVLEASLISSFSIENYHFINTKKHGFVELLFKKETTSLLRKHKKIKYKKLDKSYVYYRFKEDFYYILEYNNSYFPIEKPKDFYAIFPDQKQKIKDFKKQNSFLLKNDTNEFYIKLIKSLQTNTM